jgi:hypothetical protein
MQWVLSIMVEERDGTIVRDGSLAEGGEEVVTGGDCGRSVWRGREEGWVGEGRGR